MIAGLIFMASQAPTEDNFKNAIEDRGFTEVVTGNYSFVGCSKGQLYNVTFTGKINGRTVNGIVCSDAFHNYTILTR